MVVLGGLGLSYSGLIRPRGAGFYCNDQSIKFPFKGDTISVAQLFLGSLLAPIFFVSFFIESMCVGHSIMMFSLNFMTDTAC